MTVVTPVPGSPGAGRSTALATKRAILGVFVGAGSARVLAVAAAMLVTVRVAVGGWGRGDLIVLAVTLGISGPVEWLIHRFLLHAPHDAWSVRVLGVGVGHRKHHLDPPDIQWLMLGGVDAAVFLAAFGAVTAAWVLPLVWVTGSAAAGPFLTAWALAAIGLLHYEWVHLMVHTHYRPRTPYYRRLTRNHRLHHFRNEHHWLGVTTNAGDRLLGTYPRSKTDVPLSDTARTLDAADDEI